MNHRRDMFRIGVALHSHPAGRRAKFAERLNLEVARLENPGELAGKLAGFFVVRES